MGSLSAGVLVDPAGIIIGRNGKALRDSWEKCKLPAPDEEVEQHFWKTPENQQAMLFEENIPISPENPFLKVCFVASLILALTTSACFTTDSDQVEIGRIWAVFTVSHHPDNTVIARAELRTGGPLGTILRLTGTDHIICNDQRLVEYFEPVTGYHVSRGTIPISQDGQYRFHFVRDDETVQSTLSMPQRPEIIGTNPENSMYYTDRLTVFWDTTSPSDGIQINLEGSCINSILQSGLADNGEHTFERLAFSGQNDCPVTITVIRKVMGAVNSKFEGGYSQANRMDDMVIQFRVP